jgi:DNA-binding HxlR family transcriptional regulator
MTKQEIHALLGARWSLFILATLNNHPPMRFNALRQQVTGVSARVLAYTTRALVDAGMVARNGTVYGITASGVVVLNWSNSGPLTALGAQT